MNVLVTGGAGYIGSILVPKLLNNNHNVTVVDNFYYNQNSLLDCCYDKRLTIYEHDVRDENFIKHVLKKQDVIIPLAAIVGVAACDKDMTTSKTVNFDAIKTIVDNKSKEQILIYPNTNSGYGSTDGSLFCDEKTPLNPISFYGIIKKQSEDIVLSVDNSVSLRLATVFGISPRMRMDLLVNDFTYRALYDRFIVLFQPHFKRNYIHVRDVSSAFLHVINNIDKMKNNVYNLGLSSANLSKSELCEKIKSYINDFVIMTNDFAEDIDQRNYIVSNEKIEKNGFHPEFSIDDGIVELIKGYKIIKNNKFTNI